MKLLLVAVLAIAVVNADRQDSYDEPGETSQLIPEISEIQGGVGVDGRTIFVPATQLGDNQTSFGRSDTVLKDQLIKVDDMELLVGRSKWCKRRGGRCTNPKKSSCGNGHRESPKGRPYCTSKKRRCCYPATECPKNDGFFTIPGSNQCFKFFTEKARTFDESQLKCQNESLVLVKPDSPVVIRKYLVENFGSYYAWLGARGTGSSVNWVRDGTKIDSSSSLWYSGSPRITSTSYCLWLLSHQSNMNFKPTKPYYMYQCSSRSGYALCELAIQ